MILNAMVIVGLMAIFWLLSIWKRDVSVIDIAWGLGFVLVAWVTWVEAQFIDPRRARIFLPLMVTIWGLRLSLYLARRNSRTGEDFRYRQMREKRPNSFWWVSLFTVFGLQGAVMWIVSLPIQLGILTTQSHAIKSESLDWDRFVIGGVILWAVGLFFESVGDWQLARFKANPNNRGRVLQRGLWRYTRHPNYFGDFLVWWGFFCVAVSAGAPWLTIVSPITMTILLMRVSGVTLLERSLKQTRPGYADYMNRTSSFFPWPPIR
jgi:steroid 5-alpha reductase family enzyme